MERSRAASAEAQAEQLVGHASQLAALVQQHAAAAAAAAETKAVADDSAETLRVELAAAAVARLESDARLEQVRGAGAHDA